VAVDCQGVASTKMDAIAPNPDCQPVSPHPNCQQIFRNFVHQPWFTGAPPFPLVPVKNLQKFSNGWSPRVKEWLVDTSALTKMMCQSELSTSLDQCPLPIFWTIFFHKNLQGIEKYQSSRKESSARLSHARAKNKHIGLS
jgi:hypothetical protein